MCMGGGSPSAPTNPAPYKPGESHKAVVDEVAPDPHSLDGDTPTQQQTQRDYLRVGQDAGLKM